MPNTLSKAMKYSLKKGDISIHLIVLREANEDLQVFNGLLVFFSVFNVLLLI